MWLGLFPTMVKDYDTAKDQPAWQRMGNIRTSSSIELRAKRLGRLVGIVAEGINPDLFDEVVLAIAPALSDSLRVPFEILFAQLLAYHLSLRF
jgi:hypothetical protein